METLETLFVNNWLPRYPMATNHWRDGVKIYRRNEALTMTHIELAPKAIQNWFVMDFDVPDAEAHMYTLLNKENIPAPNMNVVNPSTGHLHSWYLLEHPVSGDKALKLRKDLTKKASIAWQADANYVNRFARNPFTHHTEILHNETTSLRSLWDALNHVTLPERAKKNINLSEVNTEGMKRNSTLFELLRVFTYSNFKAFRTNKEMFLMVVAEKAFELNLEYFHSNPLPNQEVEKTVYSIVNWTYKTFTANFSKTQKRRNAKSVAVRQAKAEEKYQNIKVYLEAGISLRDTCETLSLNYESVRKSLKKWEELYGV